MAIFHPTNLDLELVDFVYKNIHKKRIFCSLDFRSSPGKNIKIITYGNQTSHGVSTTPVLRVCPCHVIKK